MSLNIDKFRLGPANVYIDEGSPAAPVLVGYVDNVTVTVTSQRSPTHGGQLGTSDADLVVTGAQCEVDFSFQEITLESWQRALRGNTQSFVDDTTITKRRLEVQTNAGQSMRALASKLKVVPLVGAAESSNLEDILTIPLAVTAGDSVKLSYSNSTQSMIAAKYRALPDPAKRNRFWFWGDDTAVDATTPFGF